MQRLNSLLVVGCGAYSLLRTRQPCWVQVCSVAEHVLLAAAHGTCTHVAECREQRHACATDNAPHGDRGRWSDGCHYPVPRPLSTSAPATATCDARRSHSYAHCSPPTNAQQGVTYWYTHKHTQNTRTNRTRTGKAYFHERYTHNANKRTQAHACIQAYTCIRARMKNMEVGIAILFNGGFAEPLWFMCKQQGEHLPVGAEFGHVGGRQLPNLTGDRILFDQRLLREVEL